MESYSTADELIGELINFYNLDPEVDYLVNLQGILMEKGNILDQLNRFSTVSNDP